MEFNAPKILGFGMRDGIDVVTNLHWYKDKVCKGCGRTFLTLVEQQDYCSDSCKWMPNRPPYLVPMHIKEDRRDPLPRVLLGCERCAELGCTYRNISLVSTRKDGKTYVRDYVVQSEQPYGCNRW